MKQYLNLLSHIMRNGKDRTDRTGVGTRAVFGYQFRHDLCRGFPLLTTKKIFWKGVVVELLWFLRGDTNVKYLQDHGVTIWNEWAYPNGDLGPVYGKQWRRWSTREGGSIDQIARLVNGLITSPDSRRHIVSAWNPEDVPTMAIPPCHTLWQCQVDHGRLHLSLYARSIDSFLGLPFNIASYACLLSLLARWTNLLPGELIISFGDLHIYRNHFEQVAEQLSRTPRMLPALELPDRPPLPIEDWTWEDFKITAYDPYPAIKAPIAV